MPFKPIAQEEKEKRTRTEEETYKVEKEAAKAKQLAIDEKAKMIASKGGLVWPKPEPPKRAGEPTPKPQKWKDGSH